MIGVDYYVGDFLSDICNGDGEEHVAQLEAEIRRLSSELSLFRSSAKWDQVQQEKQERVQLVERVTQLEVQLADYETMSRNYTKVRNENASLVRLLANFVRHEYSIPTGGGRTTPPRTAAATGSMSSTTSVESNQTPTSEFKRVVAASEPRHSTGDADSNSSLPSRTSNVPAEYSRHTVPRSWHS